MQNQVGVPSKVHPLFFINYWTMHETITSVHNERVKRMILLQQRSAERNRTGRFVVEGAREVRQAADTAHLLHAIYYCPSIASDEAAEVVAHATCEVFEVSPAVYARMAYRGTTEGIMAEAQQRNITLDDLRLGENPLLVVVESVEKPGNVGTILRSADAAAATAVILCDPRADKYNPNLIRSSIGAVFTVPCVCCTTEQCIAFLKEHGVRILTAQLQDSLPYYDTEMRTATALVFGTESTGLTQPWRDAADAHLRIPMRGRLDSLNVATSVAILLFEAVRQRDATALT